MNATQAHELAVRSKTKKIDIPAVFWQLAQDYIFRRIREVASDGRMGVKINLNVEALSVVNNNLDRMRVELEQLGYKVEYLLTRTPDGAREMIITW